MEEGKYKKKKKKTSEGAPTAAASPERARKNIVAQRFDKKLSHRTEKAANNFMQ
jgi:hypothetical protein